MKRNKWIINIAKIIVVALLVWAIINQIFLVDDFLNTWNLFKSSISGNVIWISVCVILLMMINWAFEAKKWQVLVNKIETIKFSESYKAIFCGVAFAMITPNRIGEYAGRIFYTRKAGVIKTIAVTMIGSFSQVITTTFFGLVGLMFYIIIYAGQSSYVNAIIYFSALSTIGILFLMFFNLQKIYSSIQDIKYLKKIKTYLLIISQYSGKEFIKVLAFSVLRYITFTIQYLLLLNLFGVHETYFHMTIMITLIFLVQTIIPSFAIAEIGIRGNVALFFLGMVSENHLGIWSAASCLWLVNLVLPSIIGSFYFLKINSNK